MMLSNIRANLYSLFHTADILRECSDKSSMENTCRVMNKQNLGKAHNAGAKRMPQLHNKTVALPHQGKRRHSGLVLETLSTLIGLFNHSDLLFTSTKDMPSPGRYKNSVLFFILWCCLFPFLFLSNLFPFPF